tara:strand:+ start:2328 stop:2879 length:552 start_codon:yes stop_codon:yes gene_type:complete
MKGISVVFDTEFDEGWRSRMEIVLIATWDGQEGAQIYTDIAMTRKMIGCPVHDLSDFVWEEQAPLVGHNLHGQFKNECFDLLHAVKKASAEVLQNEGKRFALFDLARWNRCQTVPVEMYSKWRRGMARIRGQHIKIARWGIEDAMMCYDLYVKVRKTGRVRFLNVKTGKKSFAEVLWGNEEEE